MNTIPLLRTVVPCNDDDRTAAVLLLDRTIGELMDVIGDMMAALYAPRRPLSAGQRSEAERLRAALVALSHARNLVEPLMVERGS